MAEEVNEVITPQMMLADQAQVVGGKLYVNGGWWTTCSPEPFPYWLAIRFTVPWAQVGENHVFELILVDGRGRLVTGPDGSEPLIKVEGQFGADRAPGVLLGGPADVVQAIPVPPMRLEPGRYAWKLSINGHSNVDWELPFTVASRPGQQRLAS